MSSSHSSNVRCRRAFPGFFDPTTLSSLRSCGRTGTLIDVSRSNNGIHFKDDAGYIGYISDEGDEDDGDGDFRNMRYSSSFGNLYHLRNQILGPDITFMHSFIVLCILILIPFIVYLFCRIC
jgi:hypothetical protein